jgi:hypothetical protein
MVVVANQPVLPRACAEATTSPLVRPATARRYVVCHPAALCHRLGLSQAGP